MDRLLIYNKSEPSRIDEETEEDRKILEEQEKFMKKLKENKIKPAAKIVRHEDKSNIIESASSTGEDISEQIVNTFEYIPKNAVVGPIVEKRKNEDDSYKVPPLRCNAYGFPRAKRRDINVGGGSGSLFAQEMKEHGKGEDATTVASTSISGKKKLIATDVGNNFNENIGSGLVHHSTILSDNEKKEIHEQNLNILKSTPESEILAEKERLLSGLNPAILAYLQSRKKENVNKSTNLTITQQNDAGQNIDLNSIKSTVEILSTLGSDKWLNFNQLETNKLAWMKEIEMPKIDKDKAFEARFDFEGWLLPFTQPEINEKNRILYHHGEEPERPGYTLKELFTLARSNITQQKIIALNSIANILSLYSSGVYQDVLEIPIEQVFFLIRFCLDDNTPGVLNAGIKAMRCLIFNYSDETYLDCLLGFGFDVKMPVLPVDNEEKDDDRVNDQQLAENNLIKCLVRTGIYTRIRYIINTMRPTLETIVYCLEILIRLSRDSNFVVSTMFMCEDLVSSIVKNFIPENYTYNHQESAYGLPVLQALKLVRVLTARNEILANKFVNEYNIVEAISRYLQDEIFGGNASGIKLQTECFHLWKILLKYGLTLDYHETLISILLKYLDYHIKQTDIDEKTTFIREAHCAAMLSLLGEFIILKPSIVSKFDQLYLVALKKWSTQFQRISDFKSGQSQIISSLMILSSKIYRYSKLTRQIEESVANLLKSKGFAESVLEIKNCSMLLNNYDPQPFSANLKTLQTSAWYASEHVIPILQTTSCFPFIRALSQFLSGCDSMFLKLSFLENNTIKSYIEALAHQQSLFLTSHWFTRIESQLILNLLKISVDLCKEIDTANFYAVAVKSLCIFNEDQKEEIKYLMEKIIFCTKFYPSEILLSNLNLYERNENLEISLKNLDAIKHVYFKVLGLSEKRDSPQSFCLDIGIGNVIPVDWVYTPILILYSNQQEKNNVLSEQQQTFIVTNCLRWVLIYEMYFPSLVLAVSPTDRFCRLACVFLGSDVLFLNQEIHQLLELCLKNILSKFEKKLDFNKPIKGLKNFQDFYNQMLEQYQGVSYGDILFGNFVLVPLSQKQNVQWRKTLWSEYYGVVQILDISRKQLMTSLDNYLQPLEEDESLLKCYKNALSMATVKSTSVLHVIANHHYICRRHKL
ncbi:RNA polymerase II-associated protein 1 isoform X2 [Harmonia axyridis]|uniref:RNA polymerase II-associated protein 1 isoform X2 n=1 Tax=Harmonia axyridis TaxID=115357 RepID=UPI001E2792CE|nr:RNA polymerase II-associated protein 1 isoform X2 [Harmonia axyridis]